MGRLRDGMLGVRRGGRGLRRGGRGLVRGVDRARRRRLLRLRGGGAGLWIIAAGLRPRLGGPRSGVASALIPDDRPGGRMALHGGPRQGIPWGVGVEARRITAPTALGIGREVSWG